MLNNIIFLVIGSYFLYQGAIYLVKHSSRLARNLGITKFLIGLTIVAFGTSAPELFIGLFTAIKGTTNLSLGNVIGASILNITLIFAIASFIHPVTIKSETFKKEIPILLIVSCLLLVLSLDSVISKFDGVILLLFFAVFMFFHTRKYDEVTRIYHDGLDKNEITKKKLKNIFFIIISILFLYIGAKFVIESAVNIARILNISEMLIAITLISIGTTLPELSTAIIASIKKSNSLVVGDSLGSGIFNILFIIGLVSIISPISVPSRTIFFNIPALIVFVITLIILARNNKITREKGILLLILYLIYIGLLFITEFYG